MTDEQEARKAAAIAELDKLAAAFKETEEAHAQARDALRAAIEGYLRDRVVTPGEASKHSGYDRNHIGRIARAAGIPPLRKRTVRSVRDAPHTNNSPGTAA